VPHTGSLDSKDGWLVLEGRTNKQKEHKGSRLRKGLRTWAEPTPSL